MKHVKNRVENLLSIILFCSTTLYTKNVDGTRSYDWGLPDGDEVFNSLMIANPLLLGFLLISARR